jgi:hypothetical protein
MPTSPAKSAPDAAIAALADSIDRFLVIHQRAAAATLAAAVIASRGEPVSVDEALAITRKLLDAGRAEAGAGSRRG